MSCRETYLRLCDVKPDKLDEPCTEVSLHYLARAISDWERLAPFLEISDPEVVAIRRNFPNSYQQQKVHLLLQWQEKVGRMNATYRNIFIVLETHTTEQLTWDGSELDQPLDDIELAFLANTLEKWEEVAPHLSLTAAEREEIRRDSQNYWNQKHSMLVRWREKVGESATRRTIIAALWEVKAEKIVENLLYLPAQGRDLVVLFREHLKQCYLCQPPPSATQWPPKGHPIYIPPTLTLVPSSPLKQRAINDANTAIELSKIFTSAGSGQYGKFVRVCILLKGSAGSGKSTAIWHATQEWAKGASFADFDLVLAMSLDSPAVRSASSLEELIPHPDKQVRKEVARYINEKGGEKIGFLLDGLDQIPPRERQGDAYLVRLLKGDLQVSFPKASILVTSRPEGATPDLKITWSTTILLEGFSKQQSMAYFENTGFGGKSFDRAVATNPALFSLVSLPMNAAILSYLLEIRKPTQSLPTTRTELYDLFLTNTLLRNLQERLSSDVSAIEELPDYDSLPAVVHDTFWQLCHLAWLGMNQSKSVFTQSDISKAGIDPEKLHILGLTMQSRVLTPRGISSQYMFHHISIQEFLAALHLSSKCSEDKQIVACQQLIRNMFGHVAKTSQSKTASVVPHIDNPWAEVPTFFLIPFFVGLEPQQEQRKKVAEKVIDILLSMYADRKSNKPDNISDELWSVRDILSSAAAAHFPLTQCLYCVYEAQSPELCHSVTLSFLEEMDSTILLSIPGYVDQGIAACVGYYLAHWRSSKPLEIQLWVSSGAFSDLGIALMIQQFQMTRSGLDPETQRMVAQSASCTMRLRFTGRGVSHEGIRTISHSLDKLHPMLSITELQLIDGWAPGTDKGAALTTIVDALATHEYLKLLTLDQCLITVQHVEVLQRLLTECIQLEDLSLRGSKLGDAVTYLAPHIGRHKSLRRLSLAFCELTPGALKKLGEHLAQNSLLEYLYIDGNHFSAYDLEVFLTMMKGNKSLKGLCCWDNELPFGLKLIVNEINTIRKAENSEKLPELKVMSRNFIEEFVTDLTRTNFAQLEHTATMIKDSSQTCH